MQRRLFLVVPLALGLVFAGGCGGGGGESSDSTGSGGSSGATGDTSVPGLEVATQMAIVPASESASANLAKALRGLKAAPTGGDYVTDEAEIYVYDESMEALDQFNEIMCSIGQTLYADMVNRGDYIALIDADKCSKSGRGGESSNESTAVAQDFEEWVVNSSRADASSPHIVTAWIPMDDDFFDEVRGKMIITEGVSSSNKYGIFQLNFIAYSAGTPVMHAFLSASLAEDGRIALQLNMGEEGFMQEQLYALVSPDGSTGQASVHRSIMAEGSGRSANLAKSPPEEKGVNVAFDRSHYLADYGDDQECLDRINLDERAWSYNLYDATGAREVLNGGMSFKVGEVQGWSSYYGLWLPEEEITLASGLAVVGEDEAAYTTFLGGGRFVRRVRHTLQLGDFIGATFKHWDNDSGGQLHVRWDGTEFLVVGHEECTEGGGCTFSAEATPSPVSLSPNDWFGLWKDGLGNVDLVVPENGRITNDMEIPYYTNEFVAPTDAVLARGEITLKCYTQCLRPNLAQDTVASGDIYFPDAESVDSPYLYTFSADEYVLRYNGEPVQVVEGADLTGTMFSWGVHGGAMLLGDAELANIWDVWGQEETFIFETGPNQWNRYSALVDANGAIVEYDQPLQCLYTHVIPASEESEGSSEAFLMDYQGAGQLHGIPWEEIEDDDSEFSHWEPLFTIHDGEEVNCDGRILYARPIAMEQTMPEVELSECAALSVTDLGAPTGTFADPEMGERPDVTGDPAVVGGVLQ